MTMRADVDVVVVVSSGRNPPLEIVSRRTVVAADAFVVADAELKAPGNGIRTR